MIFFHINQFVIAAMDRGDNSNPLSQDWQSKRTQVKARITHLFNNNLLSDVYFLVGKGEKSSKQRIPAHKLVLSTGSSVFYAMFNGSLAMNTEVIEVPDIEPEIFLALLRYVSWWNSLNAFAGIVISTNFQVENLQVGLLLRT